MIAVVTFAGIVHFKRCCSTSGLLAVTSFHMLAISSAVSGSPSGKAMHITRNLSLFTGWICCPFWITTFMLAEVIGERVPDDGRTRYLSGAVVLTWKWAGRAFYLSLIPVLSSVVNLSNEVNRRRDNCCWHARFAFRVNVWQRGDTFEVNGEVGSTCGELLSWNKSRR